MSRHVPRQKRLWRTVPLSHDERHRLCRQKEQSEGAAGGRMPPVQETLGVGGMHPGVSTKRTTPKKEFSPDSLSQTYPSCHRIDGGSLLVHCTVQQWAGRTTRRRAPDLFNDPSYLPESRLRPGRIVAQRLEEPGPDPGPVPVGIAVTKLQPTATPKAIRRCPEVPRSAGAAVAAKHDFPLSLAGRGLVPGWIRPFPGRLRHHPRVAGFGGHRVGFGISQGPAKPLGSRVLHRSLRPTGAAQPCPPAPRMPQQRARPLPPRRVRRRAQPPPAALAAGRPRGHARHAGRPEGLLRYQWPPAVPHGVLELPSLGVHGRLPVSVRKGPVALQPVHVPGPDFLPESGTPVSLRVSILAVHTPLRGNFVC
mmetsp:Transcript_92794/g.189012  ORF Transcript_92794/g.189012 Transcript_92794/m.189012 type:complete len:365 (-) Transcript_92794:60-1154(-)